MKERRRSMCRSLRGGASGGYPDVPQKWKPENAPRQISMGYPFFSSNAPYEIQVNFSAGNTTYYWNHTLESDRFTINLTDECRGLALGSDVIYFQVKLPDDANIQFADSGNLNIMEWDSYKGLNATYNSIESYSHSGSPFINDITPISGLGHYFQFTTYVNNIANGVTIYFTMEGNGPLFTYSIVPRGYSFIL